MIACRPRFVECGKVGWNKFSRSQRSGFVVGPNTNQRVMLSFIHSAMPVKKESAVLCTSGFEKASRRKCHCWLQKPESHLFELSQFRG